MERVVELYWSFRSPYSYIVLPRIRALAENFRVTVDLRVVHPNAIRNPTYFARMDPLARPYFLKDSAHAGQWADQTFEVLERVEAALVRPAYGPRQPAPKPEQVARENRANWGQD